MTPCPGDHDDEFVGHAGGMTFTRCRRCGMRHVRGLGDGERVPEPWVDWLSGATDDVPESGERTGEA